MEREVRRKFDPSPHSSVPLLWFCLRVPEEINSSAEREIRNYSDCSKNCRAQASVKDRQVMVIEETPGWDYQGVYWYNMDCILHQVYSIAPIHCVYTWMYDVFGSSGWIQSLGRFEQKLPSRLVAGR
ncbi:hypothetical protein KQX54_015405 [Cotesia glomerata]|uniref:Uncharacterized protein n=1 Tax=Cotesia glomerata TaxID=32391 RepID=A0AAV7IT65_COTGL|nr:hypothetical protein KQX54_015405 [Cotesia glomerata]